MFSSILVMLVFLSCSNNKIFFNRYKVRKISSEQINKQIFLAVKQITQNKAISEPELKNTLLPFIKKFSQPIEGESICSLIIESTDLFLMSNMSEEILLNVIFDIIIENREIAERELTFFNNSGENLIHIISENHGFDFLDKLMDKINLINDLNKKATFKKCFFECLISFWGNNTSVLDLCMKKNKDLSTKIINFFIFNDTKVKIIKKRDFCINQKITPYEESIFSLSMKYDHKKIFDNMFRDLIGKVSRIDLMSSACSMNDNPYYLEMILLEKDFYMNEDIYHNLIIHASINKKENIIEQLLAYGFGHYGLSIDINEIEKMLKKGLLKISKLLISDLPNVIDNALSLSGLAEPITLGITTATKTLKPLAKPLGNTIAERIDKTIEKINKNEIEQKEINKMLSTAKEVKVKLKWLERVDLDIFSKEDGLLNIEKRKGHNRLDELKYIFELALGVQAEENTSGKKKSKESNIQENSEKREIQENSDLSLKEMCIFLKSNVKNLVCDITDIGESSGDKGAEDNAINAIKKVISKCTSLSSASKPGNKKQIAKLRLIKDELISLNQLLENTIGENTGASNKCIVDIRASIKNISTKEKPHEEINQIKQKIEAARNDIEKANFLINKCKAKINFIKHKPKAECSTI